MTAVALRDALAHHAWATSRLLEVCRALSDEQLATTVPGTFGSVIDTLRHTVGADCWYLLRLTADHEPIDEDGADIEALRSEMTAHGEAWATLVAGDFDADEPITVRRDDGTATRATRGIRIAQVLHHGTDHRSQVCTALTTLGIEPPEIDAWAYGLEVGSVADVQAADA
jgi:uncharacterized damage-inducible protein DinB